jgi:hypothetical protein
MGNGIEIWGISEVLVKLKKPEQVIDYLGMMVM